MDLPPWLEAPRDGDWTRFLALGSAWLERAPRSAPALAYAAWELGNALEALALELLEFLRDGNLSERDLRQRSGGHSLVGYLLQAPGAKVLLGRKLRLHRRVMEIADSPYARAEFDPGSLVPLREACAARCRPLRPPDPEGWADDLRELERARGFLAGVADARGRGWRRYHHKDLCILQDRWLRGKVAAGALEGELSRLRPLLEGGKF